MSTEIKMNRQRAVNRPSIGFARHRRFSREEQPSLAVFAQVLAHRIRGLLTGIEGFTDLLLQTFDSPDQRDLAFRILESTSRVEGILFDLQHYDDPLEANFHKYSVNSVTSDLIAVLADSEVERLRFDVKVSDGIHIRADECLIRQSLLAVVRNAMEATANTVTPIGVCIEELGKGDEVAFRVYNTGAITNPDVRNKMFEPFYTTKAHNLGLGLSLARRIARIHGGELTLTSGPEEPGTEITLRLPVLKD